MTTLVYPWKADLRLWEFGLLIAEERNRKIEQQALKKETENASKYAALEQVLG